MGKKSKKNSKINQKIKKYFDDDPFDVGIERVDSQTLSELFHALGIYDLDFSKDLMVKNARMIWSQADTQTRLNILDFFSANDRVYNSSKEKVLSTTNVEKIEELLEKFELSKDEAQEIQIAFAQTRTKKITEEKIEAKLRHIRFELKKETLEKALDGHFDLDDSLEFNGSLRYKIYEHHFHKILTLKTKPYDYKFLHETDLEDLIEKISRDKDETVRQKQRDIESFIANLQNPHPYLSKDEIISSLRKSEPKSDLDYPNIKASILKKIFQKYLDLFDITVQDKEILLNINEEVSLPFSDKKFSYNLELHIGLDSFLETVWSGSVIDLENLHAETKESHEEQFFFELSELVKECGNYAMLLHLSDEVLHEKVYEYLLDLLPNTLRITPKIARKTRRIFIYNIQDELIKKQRHALLARTIRDFKNLFPIARDMRRKLTLHIGPTNSGKTYEAMKRLENADTGYYLAPLRLLALEGYEGLKDKGIDVSLITGEEQILDEDATHISSTIEMLNFDVDVDVCVIDEVQMIDDRDRGWAWANAIIGAPAKEIIMTGSPNAKEAVVALAEYLGEKLEIIEFERKNPLRVLESVTEIENVEPATAIIAFSRKDVLGLKQKFAKYFKVSVVYGNLSPEVRREEARRFRQGETEILVATDAIAMGMNLPIKTLLFSKAEKFDGVTQRNLFASEVHQISGRAGRFGMNEEGYVGALNTETLKIVKKNFFKEAKSITIPFKVMANLDHIQLVANILEEDSLEEILKFFVENMEFNGPFHATNLDDMLAASEIVDRFELDIATKYHLACAPLTLKSPYILSAYEEFIASLEQKKPVRYTPPTLYGSFAQTTDELLRAEDMVKEISLYLWLSYRFDEYFVDQQKAKVTRAILNKYIEESLQQSYFVQTCKICHKPLPLNFRYGICQSCFKKNYTKRHTRRR